MANLIDWANLHPGMEVWEECVWGTGTIRCRVVGEEDRDHKVMRYVLTDSTFAQTVKKHKEFRYWDSAPTLEEREETPWWKD